MQELLGRLGALDPEASQGLRVIACFDELMSGGVALRGLLSAAAALAGVPVGFARKNQVLRITSRGEELPGEPPAARIEATIRGEATVWIERHPEQALANDAIILERLALAARLRIDPASRTTGLDAVKRDLATLLDRSSKRQDLITAAARLHLTAGAKYRALAAPLFASWKLRPHGPEDVIWTASGPVHVVVVRDGSAASGAPLGLGIAATTEELALSFRTALIALKLHDGLSTDPVHADDFGGLAELLADLPEDDRPDRDAAAIDDLMRHPWGEMTVASLVATSSIREAAREAGVHHSTMTTRVDALIAGLGFDPLTGLGRTRLGIAYLRWRLRHSRVFELPQPAGT